jgi:hypothetical protein
MLWNKRNSSRINFNFSQDNKKDSNFSPLKLPNKLNVDVVNVSAKSIENIEVDFKLELKPGSYNFSITKGEPLIVIVNSKTECKGSINANKIVRNNVEQTIITGVDLEFDNDVVLDNVISTLINLPSLFDDYDISVLKAFMKTLGMPEISILATHITKELSSKISEGLNSLGLFNNKISRRFSSFAKKIEEGARVLKDSYSSGLDNLPKINLRKVSARPRKYKGNWELELRFTGQLSHPNKTIKDFDDIILPHAVIPAIHADLDKIISSEPLSSASIHMEQVNIEEIAKQFGKSVSQISGRFKLQGESPILGLLFVLHDQAQVNTNLFYDEKLIVFGEFNGKNSEHLLNLNASDIIIQSKNSKLHLNSEFSIETQVDSDKSAVEAIIKSIKTGDLSYEDINMEFKTKILEKSHIDNLKMVINYSHPLVKGGIEFFIDLENIITSGDIFSISPFNSKSIITDDLKLNFSSNIKMDHTDEIVDGITKIIPEKIEGKIHGLLKWRESSGLEMKLNGNSVFDVVVKHPLDAIPELNIDEGELSILSDGIIDFRSNIKTEKLENGLVSVDFKGTEGSLLFNNLSIIHKDRKLNIPSSSRLMVNLNKAILDSSGTGESDIGFKWDLNEKSPTLSKGKKVIKILVKELLKGDINLLVNPAGGLTITGYEKGLYDAHYFNALLNPGAELDRWIEIFEDDETINRVVKALELFSVDYSELLLKIRDFVLKVKNILKKEGIEDPKDIIPGRKLAKLLSLIFSDTPDYEDEFFNIVKNVTDGKGLQTVKLKKLLNEILPDHDYYFELNKGVKWLAIVLNPVLDGMKNHINHQKPYCEEEKYSYLFEKYPGASEIYEKIQSLEPVSKKFSELLSRVSPYLTLEQLNWILEQKNSGLEQLHFDRINYVKHLKERVQIISDEFGGFSYSPQCYSIAFFLSEATQSPYFDNSEMIGNIYLGPADVAALLLSGLASPYQGRTVQVNCAMIFNYIKKQHPSFLTQVFTEICDNSPRILLNILYGLLELEQTLISEPINLFELFSEKLEVEIPNRFHYMAGGKLARKSYLDALSEVSKKILSKNNEYLALKSHLQVCRKPASESVKISEISKIYEEKIIKAINSADSLGKKCTFSKREKVRQDKAKLAYKKAFNLCREFLEKEDKAFQFPWFKEFWLRNYEALIVLSVLKNHEGNVDKVRYWLKTKSGKSSFENRQELLFTIIDSLYHDENDRENLKSDPLVRLLIENPKGKYDFTIISCMGVITKGEMGSELEDAYKRIKKVRGVNTIRANTYTARSLDFNALKIEEAVKKVKTPWGYIGYSQGCANGLSMESMLFGGTPDQHELLNDLKTRNLLFSAINGSAHGTLGNKKFIKALVFSDLFLKHYQAVFSSKAINFFLNNLGYVLDSKLSINLMGGVQSLSYEGINDLAIGGQFKGTCPTTILRGVISENNVPESLEMLGNVLTRQIKSELHDTQVEVNEAVGSFVWNQNPWCDVLKYCDMGSLIEKCHHWSPLYKAVEFLTTERDKKDAIFNMPKDRHVFPWIEVHARFGIIKSK